MSNEEIQQGDQGMECVCGETAELMGIGDSGHVVFECRGCGRTGFPASMTRDGATKNWLRRMTLAGRICKNG